MSNFRLLQIHLGADFTAMKIAVDNVFKQMLNRRRLWNPISSVPPIFIYYTFSLRWCREPRSRMAMRSRERISCTPFVPPLETQFLFRIANSNPVYQFRQSRLLNMVLAELGKVFWLWLPTFFCQVMIGLNGFEDPRQTLKTYPPLKGKTVQQRSRDDLIGRYQDYKDQVIGQASF